MQKKESAASLLCGTFLLSFVCKNIRHGKGGHSDAIIKRWHISSTQNSNNELLDFQKHGMVIYIEINDVTPTENLFKAKYIPSAESTLNTPIFINLRAMERAQGFTDGIADTIFFRSLRVMNLHTRRKSLLNMQIVKLHITALRWPSMRQAKNREQWNGVSEPQSVSLQAMIQQ